ncbi:sugar ABC transporter permease [Marispirochaeta sp.]|jgi:glucose/mannose transport system permease protein|uniref:carbohydrate ABC transporter permease n=1 Tax=Marispirochaeta sp. TaxID=2038653 RepID=UPI0029C67327|nr:sugar ABC transporter permease [Marispirochaeta sp.]
MKKLGETTSLLVVTVPILTVVFLLFYYAVGWNFYISFTDWKGFIPTYNWLGLKNYYELFTDSLFWISLKNNLLLIVVFVPGVLLIGLLFAIFLDQNIKGEGFFRTVFLLPFSLSFVVTATLWTWMYSPKVGTINTLLGMAGLDFLQAGWITEPNLVMFSIIVALIWQFGGYSVIIFLGGIRSIPDSSIEAAKMEGASSLQLYLKIIIPQLKASFVTGFIVFMCFALKAFDFIWVLNKGGPGYSSHILGVSMYKETFVLDKYSYGASYSSIIFLLSLLLVVPFLTKIYSRK